jgi:hypothetical protein
MLDPDSFHANAVTDANVTIYFGGLGVANLFPKVSATTWHTILLENAASTHHPNEHIASLTKYERTSGGLSSPVNLPLASHSNEERTVSIGASNQQAATEYFTSSGTDVRSIDHMGDFSSDELHDKAVRIAQSTTVAGTKTSRISVTGGTGYNGRFAQYCEGEPDNYVFGPVVGEPVGRKLGSWLAIDLRVDPSNGDPPSTLTISSGNDQTGSTITHTIEILAGVKYYFIFDNECPGGDTENDFNYYYTCEGGIVDEAGIELNMVSQPTCDLTLNRVACNIMIAKEIAFDQQEMSLLESLSQTQTHVC